MRNKPPRAYEDEVEEVGDDLWVLRLRSHDWCPTTHGPRRPERVWLRTAEVERRFGRQGSDAGALLPLLDVDPGSSRGKHAASPTPSESAPSSRPRVSHPMMRGVFLTASRFALATPRRRTDLRERDLRQVIRPAYRNLMELLPGHRGRDVAGLRGRNLAGSPLLVHDGRGNYRFQRIGSSPLRRSLRNA